MNKLFLISTLIFTSYGLSVQQGILTATKQFELLDASGNKYVLNSNGDCVTNCTKFDEIRKLANQ